MKYESFHKSFFSVEKIAFTARRGNFDQRVERAAAEH
jgi:hypothetical protein